MSRNGDFLIVASEYTTGNAGKDSEKVKVSSHTGGVIPVLHHRPTVLTTKQATT